MNTLFRNSTPFARRYLAAACATPVGVTRSDARDLQRQRGDLSGGE